MKDLRIARAAAATLVDWIAPLLAGEDPPALTPRRKGSWNRASKVWHLLEPTPGERPSLEQVARRVLVRWDEPAQRAVRSQRRHQAITDLSAQLGETLGEDDTLLVKLADLLGHPMPLTFFLLHHTVTKFEDALKVGALEKDLTLYDLGSDRAREVFGPGTGIEARLFVVETVPLYPDWLVFLQEGFGDVTLAESAANQAVLVVKVAHRLGDRFFALPFGAGWMLLEPSSYERDFGLVAALNAIYGAGAARPAATTGGNPIVRQVSYTTVSRIVLRTRRQASRLASIDEFGVDPRRDLLAGIAGKPADPDTWGDLILGGDSLRLKVPVRFAELGTWCRKLLDLRSETTYQERFAWIDKVKPVEDAALIAVLEAKILEELKAHPEGGSKLELAPPEVLDLGRIAGFTVSLGDDGPETERMSDVFLDDYLRALGPRLADLDLDRLQHRHMVHAYDSDGEEVGRWPVSLWLDGDVEHDGEVYTLLEGEYRKVDRAYLEGLDDFLAKIKEWNRYTLPLFNEAPRREEKKAGDGVDEGDYNEYLGKTSRFLCLDRKTVRVESQTGSTEPPGSTEPIELCDLLSPDGDFIHVKCKFRSSSLSHLFSQGAVAAKLFLDPEFRKAALAKIEEITKEKGAEDVGLFSRHFLPTGHDPVDHNAVVYAIVGPWAQKTGNGRAPAGTKLARALPFFSKVNLRSRAEELVRLGYRVYYKPIEEGEVASAVSAPDAEPAVAAAP